MCRVKYSEYGAVKLRNQSEDFCDGSMVFLVLSQVITNLRFPFSLIAQLHEYVMLVKMVNVLLGCVINYYLETTQKS